MSAASASPSRAAEAAAPVRFPRKLRVSVTERCDLACAYCGRPRAPRPELAPDECARLAGILAEVGIEEIRLTGGEPLIRPDATEVVSAFRGIPVRRSITTNGQKLDSFADLLAGSGFDRANVSLDSLRPEVFRRLSGGGALERTLDGIAAARTAGLEVKINCVVLRAANSGEIEAFHDLSARTGMEVRFLELLPAGDALGLEEEFFPVDEILRRLESHAGPLREMPSPAGSTSFRATSAAGARLGFVAGRSRPFCGSCDRLRLSATGTLHPCLFLEEGIPLAGLPAPRVRELAKEAFARKPSLRPASIGRPLREIGG